MWSRLASLLNFLPTEDQIEQAGITYRDLHACIIMLLPLNCYSCIVTSYRFGAF